MTKLFEQYNVIDVKIKIKPLEVFDIQNLCLTKVGLHECLV